MTGERVADEQESRETRRSSEVEKALVEDPLAAFFEKHWQMLLYGIVGIAAIWYITVSYLRSQEEILRRNADLYNKVVESYSTLFAANDRGGVSAAENIGSEDGSKEGGRALQDEQLSLFQSRLAALADTKDPYKSLAIAYDVSRLIRFGDIEEARTKAALLPWSPPRGMESEEQFISELIHLSVGRALLDSDEAAGEGRELLGSLVEQGQIVAVAAALTLSRSAQTVEEQEKALALIESLETRQPEQRDLLDPEKERLERILNDRR